MKNRIVAVGAVGICLALGGLPLEQSGIAARLPAQSANQRRLLDYQVTLQFAQNNSEAAAGTDDQLTVIFANRSAEGPAPPQPFFPDDIMQEFSFSGHDFVNGQMRFSRRVRDKSFLEARYIRVVNYGTDGWAGDRIWLTVDGEEILSAVRMLPRRGADPSKGFQNFNPRNWSQRTYWEAELQQFRKVMKGD